MSDIASNEDPDSRGDSEMVPKGRHDGLSDEELVLKPKIDQSAIHAQMFLALNQCGEGRTMAEIEFRLSYSRKSTSVPA